MYSLFKNRTRKNSKCEISVLFQYKNRRLDSEELFTITYDEVNHRKLVREVAVANKTGQQFFLL
jgi:hypothetical protein